MFRRCQVLGDDDEAGGDRLGRGDECVQVAADRVEVFVVAWAGLDFVRVLEAVGGAVLEVGFG